MLRVTCILTREPASLHIPINTKPMAFNPYNICFAAKYPANASLLIVQFRSRDLGVYTEKYLHPVLNGPWHRK